MHPKQRDASWRPVLTIGEERGSRWLVLCDHAANTVPDWLNSGSLGLSEPEMARHIAYDIGAAGVALRLAERLDGPALMANFSRLVIDPNRGLDDPTLVRRLSDQTIIPANRDVQKDEITRRIQACYYPYHNEIVRLAERRPDTAIVSIHSFTPQMRNGALRPWHTGILFAQDARLSLPLLDLLGQDADLCVGQNEPYSGHLDGDTIAQHGIRTGRQNTLIEIRSDLIETDEGQANWAERLAILLPKALEMAETQGTR